MKKILAIILSAAAILSLAGSCQKNGGNGGGGSSTEGYFFKDAFNFNVTSNPVIELPVVRLGNSGDLTVNLTATGDVDVFTVPSSVTIKDGDRMAAAVITYKDGSLTFNKVYNLVVTVSDYSSVYGYENATISIEYPTSYYKYGSGTMNEEWWAEVEDGKDLYVRDFAANLLQCYVPDCWGHDSGPTYDVQDYVFYWNTQTNQCYVPVQYMGWQYMSDMGAKTCQFGGPGYEEASSEWFSYIDTYYTQNTLLVHPHFDPEKNVFYLADSNWFNASGVNTSNDPPAKNDTFVLD